MQISQYMRCGAAIASIFFVSACHADLMITGFDATDEETSFTWQGFGFEVTSPVTVSGFGVVDLGDLGIAPAEARLWSINGSLSFTELAIATFTGGVSEELATSASFQYSGTTPGIGVNGFRLADFAGADVGLVPGTQYVVAARANVANPFGDLSGESPLEFFQSVTGTFPGSHAVTVSSPFQIISSFAAVDQLNADSNDLSTDYFGLQGFDEANQDVNVPPFNSLVSAGFDFNPIVVNLFSGELSENIPDPPVVPEPSSFILCGLAVLFSAVFLRKRRPVLQG